MGLEFFCEDRCMSEDRDWGGSRWIIAALKHILLGIFYFILAIDMEEFAIILKNEGNDWRKADELIHHLNLLARLLYFFIGQFPIFMIGRFFIILFVNIFCCAC